MDRRIFLTGSFCTVGLLSLKYKSHAKESGMGLGTSGTNSQLLIGDNENQFKGLIIVGTEHGYHSISAPSRAHEIILHPHDNNIVFCTPKLENEAYLVDLKEQKLLKTIASTSDEVFYGHSVYTSDGKHVLCTMNNKKEKKGFISVREASTLEEVHRYSSYGSLPHQIRWFVPDHSIIVVNSHPETEDKNQHHSNLCIIDVKTGNLIKKYETSDQHHSHFSLTKDQKNVILCRATKENDLTLYEKLNLTDGSLTIGKESTPASGHDVESLNHILFEDKSIAAITVIGQKRLVFWDYKNNKTLFSETFQDEPRAIIHDHTRKTVYVSFRTAKNVCYINAYHTDSFLRYELNPMASLKGGTGSHFTLI